MPMMRWRPKPSGCWDWHIKTWILSIYKERNWKGSCFCRSGRYDKIHRDLKLKTAKYVNGPYKAGYDLSDHKLQGLLSRELGI